MLTLWINVAVYADIFFCFDTLKCFKVLLILSINVLYTVGTNSILYPPNNHHRKNHFQIPQGSIWPQLYINILQLLDVKLLMTSFMLDVANMFIHVDWC